MEGTELVAQIVSSLGPAAVLGWYLYYTTAVSFPKIHDQMLDRMDELSNRQNQAITSVCADFTATIRDERITRREEIQMLRDELRASKAQTPA